MAGKESYVPTEIPHESRLGEAASVSDEIVVFDASPIEDEYTLFKKSITDQVITDKTRIYTSDLLSPKTQKLLRLTAGQITQLRNALDEKGILRYGLERREQLQGAPKKVYTPSDIVAFGVFAHKIGATNLESVDWEDVTAQVRADLEIDPEVRERILDIRDKEIDIPRVMYIVSGEHVSKSAKIRRDKNLTQATIQKNAAVATRTADSILTESDDWLASQQKQQKVASTLLFVSKEAQRTKEAQEEEEYLIYEAQRVGDHMPATFYDALRADYEDIVSHKQKGDFQSQQYGLTMETYAYLREASEIILARSHGQRPSFAHFQEKLQEDEIRGAIAVCYLYMRDHGCTSFKQLYDKIH